MVILAEVSGFACSFVSAYGSYGAGGTCTHQYSGWFYAGGGSGGYLTKEITVTPGTTYSIVVGSGGAGKGDDSSLVRNGNAGFVLIAYGGAVEPSGNTNWTELNWTTAGNYTWTVPEGVTKVRVAVCGGGGGSALNRGGYNQYYAVAGGSSSFGNLVTATGGEGGRALSNYDGDMGGAYGYGGNGGSPNGNAGSAGYGASSGGERVCDLI